MLTTSFVTVFMAVSLQFSNSLELENSPGLKPSADMIVSVTPYSNTGRMNISDAQLQKISLYLQKYHYNRTDWIVPPEQLYWNPVEVENALMKLICSLNRPGNYPNPANCNQFIMCPSQYQAFLASCPYGGTYDPFVDLCVYTIPDKPQCPWRVVWNNTDLPPTCQNYGQRLFWSELTLTGQPEVPCARLLRYCKKNEVIGEGKCKPGTGFSKAALACLPDDLCKEIEIDFQMPYPPKVTQTSDD